MKKCQGNAGVSGRMPVAERGEDGERTGGLARWVGFYSLSSTDDEQAQLLFSWRDGLLSLSLLDR